MGTTGAALTAASLASRAAKRRRKESRLTRMRNRIPRIPQLRLLPGIAQFLHSPRVLRSQRRQRRRLPLPKLPRPSLSELPQVSLPELPDAAELVSDHPEALWLAAVPAGVGVARLARRAPRLPIQECVDIAVPLQLAFDEWMRLEFLPEGAHSVEGIEREGRDRLTGRLKGPLGSRKWEAEIRDERDGESFAWRSVKGSDCAGLVTFHDLGQRLTRLELQLDVIPVRPLEGFELVLRLADARARNDLRRFKARLETISPDAYPESIPTPNE